METLRRARRLTCLFLAWFALSVGVAVASPVVDPQAMDTICSPAGSPTGASGGNGQDPGAGHMQDCRLCGMTGGPPVATIAGSYEPAVQAAAPVAPVFVAALAAPPPAARGPPAL